MKNFPHKVYYSCPEKINTVSISIMLNKITGLLTEIDSQLISITTNGFLQRWAATFTGEKISGKKISNPGPRSMSNDQLMGLYKLFIAGLAVGLITFILEILSTKFKVLENVFDFLCRA